MCVAECTLPKYSPAAAHESTSMLCFTSLFLPVAGKSVAAQDAASLLQLWKVYLSRLGAVGTSVVFRLSQALSDGTHVGTSSPPTLRYAMRALLASCHT